MPLSGCYWGWQEEEYISVTSNGFQSLPGHLFYNSITFTFKAEVLVFFFQQFYQQVQHIIIIIIIRILNPSGMISHLLLVWLMAVSLWHGYIAITSSLTFSQTTDSVACYCQRRRHFFYRQCCLWFTRYDALIKTSQGLSQAVPAFAFNGCTADPSVAKSRHTLHQSGTAAITRRKCDMPPWRFIDKFKTITDKYQFIIIMTALTFGKYAYKPMGLF